MRTAVVRLSEVVAAGFRLDAGAYVGGGAPHVCRHCGFAPLYDEHPNRANPAAALLEPDGIDSADPLGRSVYRCRDRDACEARR